MRLYERFGVKEYRIIDPANETLSVYTLSNPKAKGAPEARGEKEAGRNLDTGSVTGALGKQTYGRAAVYGPEDTYQSSVLAGFDLNLAGLFV